MSTALDLQDLSVFLLDPPEGDATLQHNKSFTEFNETYGDVVGKINHFLSLLPIDLGHIPDDLYDELVVPLAGDYGKIVQNGHACAILGKGINAWAGNVDRIADAADGVWEGDAAQAFKRQVRAYTLVMDGIGAIMRLGKLIFRGIGALSEKLGVVVENIIVKGAKLIVKVAKKVAEKVSGWFGWASLVYDIATNGFEYFRDLWEDIQSGLRLFQQTKALKQHVAEWAEAEQQRLDAFQKLPDVMDKLPRVTNHDILTGTIDPSLRDDLDNLKAALTGERAKAALDQIKIDVGKLSDTTGTTAPPIADDPVSEGEDAERNDPGPTESGGGGNQSRAR